MFGEHELERVAVGRDDRRLDSGLVRAGGERRDHVVRLPALELEVAVAERLDDRPEVRELLAQEIRHRPPALLVDDVAAWATAARCVGLESQATATPFGR